MCSLHLTHPSAHTLGAVGSRHPGSSRGFGALLKGLTSVVDNSCRSRDANPQLRITSSTLYPLELRLPHWHYWLRHYWAFSSSVLLHWLFLIFLLKISHRFSMMFRSGMLAGQSNAIIWSANHLEVVLALWAGAKVQLEKKISIFIKLVSRWKHKVLQNLLVDGCIGFGLDKTQWTNTSRRHGSPNKICPSLSLCIYSNFTVHSIQMGMNGYT